MMNVRNTKLAVATAVITGALLAAACGSSSSASADASTNGNDAGGAGADAANQVDAYAGPLVAWCSNQPSNFSFFVTSMDALWAIAGTPTSNLAGGLGGDFGGLAGADQLCQSIAAATGHGDKTWHAFLSVTDDGSGSAADAIDRIGAGPWYDANGRLVANNIAGLLASERPDGEAQSTVDLPDECGVPISLLGDAHDVVTGSDTSGRLASTNLESTCNDWTSSDGNVGSGAGQGDRPMCGHSFPRSGTTGRGASWLSDHPVRGCGKGANLIQNGPGEGTCIGCSGGYGAIYCFAL